MRSPQALSNGAPSMIQRHEARRARRRLLCVNFSFERDGRSIRSAPAGSSAIPLVETPAEQPVSPETSWRRAEQRYRYHRRLQAEVIVMLMGLRRSFHTAIARSWRTAGRRDCDHTNG